MQSARNADNVDHLDHLRTKTRLTLVSLVAVPFLLEHLSPSESCLPPLPIDRVGRID
jgi:hypothetical protein